MDHSWISSESSPESKSLNLGKRKMITVYPRKIVMVRAERELKIEMISEGETGKGREYAKGTETGIAVGIETEREKGTVIVKGTEIDMAREIDHGIGIWTVPANI